MAVTEHDRIDQLAVGPDGRLLLAMTEGRDYGRDTDAVLIEDFRRKLNTYLGAVRSGQVTRMAKRAGVRSDRGIEIVLFSTAKPPPAVFQMLAAVNTNLEHDAITARWEPLDSKQTRGERYEHDIVAEVARLLQPGWQHAVLWVTLLGDEGHGGVQFARSDDSVVKLELSGQLRTLLTEYKRATSDRVAGAWLSGRFEITPPHHYRTHFSWTAMPDWMQAPDEHQIRRELADYPRAGDEIPAWMREQLG